jgi:hypothetical protein
MLTRLIGTWVVVAFALPLAGCGPETHAVSWSIDFGEEELRSRAVAVEATIRAGGCDSLDVRYRSELLLGSDSPDPPRLRSAKYGFLAVARDEQCRWYAYGCTEAEFPEDGSSVTVVIENALHDEACAPEECVAGFCGEASDAGPADADSEDPADADSEDPADADSDSG